MSLTFHCEERTSNYKENDYDVIGQNMHAYRLGGAPQRSQREGPSPWLSHTIHRVPDARVHLGPPCWNEPCLVVKKQANYIGCKLALNM